MSTIEIKNLTFQYKRNKSNIVVTAIDDLSCTFVDGAFNVIVGSSGCGKTTLLRIIASLQEDYEGEVLTNSTDIKKYTINERRLAYVTQNYALYPHMTVFDNIAFPLKSLRVEREEIIRRVYKVAEELDLMDCLPRKPRYLSGGQMQRVALARAIIKDAELYLFDEPLSNIDPALRVEQRLLIKKTMQAHHSTAIYVTHDFKEAIAMADYLYVMDNGKIVISGKPLEVLDSGNEVVEDFKKATFLDGYEKESKQ